MLGALGSGWAWHPAEPACAKNLTVKLLLSKNWFVFLSVSSNLTQKCLDGKLKNLQTCPSPQNKRIQGDARGTNKAVTQAVIC